jgi:hypothetical protein
MIDVEDCSQIIPTQLDVNSHLDNPDFFVALIRLALIQRKISHRLFRSSSGRSKGQDELMLHTRELDRELLAWADTLPVDLRPGQDVFCAPPIYPLAVFFALQYHQTLIMVHRASLLLNAKVFQGQMDLHCWSSQWNKDCDQAMLFVLQLVDTLSSFWAAMALGASLEI